ncbi:hypothetical protein SKAU_G00278920 [Synaphobranchus kaupii]|uniref:Peptidase A2 domain-containing protein n=1 Tax=Synaphobranchus kaupii TaxID=118154 RepID=A0A9Q1EWN9_SYNKA|nr:hypothetical protein SKAU_G00278920 [Synaphobranchus kaupii]
MAQAAWETVVRSGERKDEDPKVFAIQGSSNVPLELEGSETPAQRSPAPRASQDHPSRHNNGAKGGKGGRSRSKGGDDGYRRNSQRGYSEQFSHQEKQSGKEGRSKRHNDLSSSRDSRYWSKEGRVYLVGWGKEPLNKMAPSPLEPPPRETLAVTHSYPFLRFLSDLVQKDKAKRIYTTVLIENCLYLNALLDTGSEISLMCSNTFTEVTKRALSISRRLRVDACNLHITSYTQDQAPITQRAWLEVAFQEMKILHPVYISRFDTESLLIGQDLLDRLTTLIDCHRGQLWAQVVAPKSIKMETDARNLCEAVTKSHRQLSAELPKAPVKSIRVCALTLQIGGREFVHYVSVAPLLSHSFYVGADILVRLGAQLDMINQVVWSQANIGRNKLTAQPEQMCSGQTIPLACQVASEFDVVIPGRTTGVPLRLMILRGQELDSTQTFFQPSPHLFELNLMVCDSPLLEVANRSVYLLVQNLTHRTTQVAARKPLSYLIDSSYHDFELTIPIIGELPNSLREFENGEGVYLTHPTNMIAIFPQEPIQSSTVCHVDLSDKVGMVLHTSTMTPNASSRGDAGTLLLEEP